MKYLRTDFPLDAEEAQQSANNLGLAHGICLRPSLEDDMPTEDGLDKAYADGYAEGKEID